MLLSNPRFKKASSLKPLFLGVAASLHLPLVTRRCIICVIHCIVCAHACGLKTMILKYTWQGALRAWLPWSNPHWPTGAEGCQQVRLLNIVLHCYTLTYGCQHARVRKWWWSSFVAASTKRESLLWESVTSKKLQPKVCSCVKKFSKSLGPLYLGMT